MSISPLFLGELALLARALPGALFVSLAALAAAPAFAQSAQFDAWFEVDDFAAIEREITRRLAADAHDRDALIARARLSLADPDSKRLDDGESAMNTCLARRPDDARCHLWLGRVYGRRAIEAGMLAGARYAGRIREHFARAVALEPEAIDARYDLNQFYILAPGLVGGGKGKARDNAADFARLRPREAVLLDAQLALAEERFADADRLLMSFGGSDDRAVRAVWQDQLAGLGFRYLSGKPPRLDDAGRVFAFAAERSPRNELFRRGLGRVAQEQGRWQDAAQHFEQALAIRSQPGAHYRLAQVAEKLGDSARAITHYEKTLRAPRGVPRSVLSDANERLKALQSAAPGKS